MLVTWLLPFQMFLSFQATLLPFLFFMSKSLFMESSVIKLLLCLGWSASLSQTACQVLPVQHNWGGQQWSAVRPEKQRRLWVVPDEYLGELRQQLITKSQNQLSWKDHRGISESSFWPCTEPPPKDTQCAWQHCPNTWAVISEKLGFQVGQFMLLYLKNVLK